jgi:hypothetical protein
MKRGDLVTLKRVYRMWRSSDHPGREFEYPIGATSLVLEIKGERVKCLIGCQCEWMPEYALISV